MLRVRANGETFVSATMCPQQCVLVCQGLNNKGEGADVNSLQDDKKRGSKQILKLPIQHRGRHLTNHSNLWNI